MTSPSGPVSIDPNLPMSQVPKPTMNSSDSPHAVPLITNKHALPQDALYDPFATVESTASSAASAASQWLRRIPEASSHLAENLTDRARAAARQLNSQAQQLKTQVNRKV